MTADAGVDTAVDAVLDPAPPAARWRTRRSTAAVALAVLGVLAVGVPVALSSSPASPAQAASNEVPPPVLVEPVPPLPVPATPPVEPVRIAGPGTPAGDSRIVDVQVGDESRAYFLLPALNLPKGTPASLLVVLHQDVGSAVPAEALDLRPAEIGVIAPLVLVLLVLSFWPAAITERLSGVFF